MIRLVSRTTRTIVWRQILWSSHRFFFSTQLFVEWVQWGGPLFLTHMCLTNSHVCAFIAASVNPFEGCASSAAAPLRRPLMKTVAALCVFSPCRIKGAIRQPLKRHAVFQELLIEQDGCLILEKAAVESSPEGKKGKKKEKSPSPGSFPPHPPLSRKSCPVTIPF